MRLAPNGTLVRERPRRPCASAGIVLALALAPSLVGCGGTPGPELGSRPAASWHVDATAGDPAGSSLAALDSAEPEAAAAIEAEDFERAMRALASLRAPIDRFFDTVTVNDADRDKRAARLDLLARFRAAVHNVADFSRIEG